MITEIGDMEVIPFASNSGEQIDIGATPYSFRPNRVTQSFLDSLPKNLDGLVCDDIGSGTGVIAIIEAYRGARLVNAVEPASENYKLLNQNIARQNSNVNGRINTHQGEYFDPLQGSEKPDIITADVSGIPETFGRSLRWYPPGIATGGVKGSEITCELLRRAPYRIKEDGLLLFPTADDLLDSEEILEAARDNFESVENALYSQEDRKAFEGRRAREELKGREKRFSPEYVWFPLTGGNIETLEQAYGGEIPSSVNIQEVSGRYFWRGRVHAARGPKTK